MQNTKSFSSPRESINLVHESNLRRYQLLRYRDVMRLSDVMETVVPIHGTGNFPTLDIEPYRLVQLVRDRLQAIGVKVRDIRLNGSAATHVLSDDTTHTYKDLDLIFAIDFPTPVSISHTIPSAQDVTHRDRDREKQSNETSEDLPSIFVESEDSSSPPRPSCLPIINRSETPRSSEKEVSDDNISLDDSGYTSSGSSGVSIPTSPCSYAPAAMNQNRKKAYRCRTRSLESLSSTSSLASARPAEDLAFLSDHYNRLNWQAIKDVAVDALLHFLPPRVSTVNMNSVVLGNAYVQKMVKVTNASDKWSLISFNNNSGRNLELKFVQSMKRQYEFSVDSFQIVLDTYLAYKEALSQTDTAAIVTLPSFFPTVIAETVFGDFDAALRHLHHRRICTHKPEEIRGGGLLRYCNLLARDFTPGDVESGYSQTDITRLEQHMCSRFFIDFNDIDRQQKKLISYLNGHFHGEERLKFEYLLILRRVVETSTICLMHHERTLILNLITNLARQSLACNLANDASDMRAASPVLQHGHYVLPQSPLVSKICCKQTQFLGEFYYPLGAGSCSPRNSYTPTITPKESPAQSRSCTPKTQSSKLTSSHKTAPDTAAESHFNKIPNKNHFNWLTSASTCTQFYQGRYPQMNVQEYPTVVQPIFYNPSKMTCYYQPAR